MAYATTDELQETIIRELGSDELKVAAALLDEAAVIIDAYNPDASDNAKKTVSIRIVRRALGDGESESSVPVGATQGSMSALGYTQSWQYGSGSYGELYLGKLEKKLLGVGDKIGSYSPVEELVEDDDGD